MAYSPAAHNTATAGRVGFVRLGSGVSGNSDGSLVSNATLLGLTKSSVGLGNVENTALSSWGGSTNITTLGAVTSGSAPASDVYAWAKAATKPSYTKTEVGLGNVENTALSSWGGSTNITTLGAVTSGSAPASDVYAWAKAATKPSYTASEVGLGNVNNTADANKSVYYAQYATNVEINGGGTYASGNTGGNGFTVAIRDTYGALYATAYYYSSDAKLKTNIDTLTNYWEVLGKIRPVSFDWIANGNSSSGFIAQEIQQVLPESVGESTDGILTINSSAIIAHLVAAVKDLKSQVDELTKQLKG